jgi:hypothetical protein
MLGEKEWEEEYGKIERGEGRRDKESERYYEWHPARIFT